LKLSKEYLKQFQILIRTFHKHLKTKKATPVNSKDKQKSKQLKAINREYMTFNITAKIKLL